MQEKAFVLYFEVMNETRFLDKREPLRRKFLGNFFQEHAIAYRDFLNHVKFPTFHFIFHRSNQNFSKNTGKTTNVCLSIKISPNIEFQGLFLCLIIEFCRLYVDLFKRPRSIETRVWFFIDVCAKMVWDECRGEFEI